MIQEKITTKSGSIYFINYENKTWRRIKGLNSSTIRSDEGTFEYANFITEYGDKSESLHLICPPFENSGVPRFIISTPIVSREVLK